MTTTPSAVWVRPARLRPSRLAAEFYRQEYTELEDQLDRSGHKLVLLGELGRLFTGPFGSKLPASLYDTPNGIPLLRVQNIGDLFLDETDLARIPLEVHEDIHRSKLEPGDLALAKAGRLGALSKIPAHIQECNITQHIVGVKVRADKVRGSYLAAFFLSRFGSFQFKRQGIGTLIQYLGIEETRAAKVVVPERGVQDYIGAKVELAERCQSHAVKLRSQALEFLAQSWAWGNRGPAELQDEAASQIAHTVEPRIFEDRLDPEFYRPRFLTVDRWLDGQPCWRLSELVEAPVKGIQPDYDSDGTVPALTVTHVDPFVLDRNGASGLVTGAWLSRNARARIEAGELLYTVTGPPLGETVVVEEFHLPAAVNSHVARVALRPHFKFPHLVAGMLNSPLGQLQTTRYSKGIRQKELYPVDFVRFRFPKLSSQTCTRLERDLAASCRLAEEARVLVEQAKADVEALIEDTLDVQAILAGTVKAPTADAIPELAEDGA